jgi:hypothetical protein
VPIGELPRIVQSSNVAPVGGSLGVDNTLYSNMRVFRIEQQRPSPQESKIAWVYPMVPSKPSRYSGQRRGKDVLGSWRSTRVEVTRVLWQDFYKNSSRAGPDRKSLGSS